MALADLDPTVAVELATQFKTINGFPWDAVDVTAQDLIRWCRGWIGKNNVWPPEAQARWLVREARETWTEKWLGTGALKELFDARFPSASRPGNEAQPLGEKPPINCQDCQDNGVLRVRGRHQYCDCGQGTLIREDAGENAQKWLDWMDRTLLPRPKASIRRSTLSIQELEAEYYAAHPPHEKEE